MIGMSRTIAPSGNCGAAYSSAQGSSLIYR
jgi:hypothetical protein